MSTVRMSEKFEVVVPQEVRDSLGLVPGEQLREIAYAGRIELIPVRAIKSMRGLLKGIDTAIERDTDRA